MPDVICFICGKNMGQRPSPQVATRKYISIEIEESERDKYHLAPEQPAVLRRCEDVCLECTEPVELKGVREYNEGPPVFLSKEFTKHLSGLITYRRVIVAINEGGYNSTCVDLDDLLSALGIVQCPKSS
jgi:hypothetical protein